ncbi:MAG: hypothetical protein DRI89_00745 [Bacteroidetes bacterium]|nr:MAG: hypothetical protein DRI89_00745 [Bacteroidota bacterium]
MKEKSSIEILEDFAKRKEIRFYTNSSVKNNFLSPSKRFSSVKFIVFDLGKVSKNLFFIFYDSFATKAQTSKTYSGLFMRTLKCKDKIKIMKRDWFDVISFKKRLKTGDPFIDKHLTIFSESDVVNTTLIHSKNMREFIQITEKIMPLELMTFQSSMSIVPELHGNDFIALRTNTWILDEKLLEYFMAKGSELLKRMK